MKLTHWQYLAATKQLESARCNVYHVTFGGRCLNCGHDPKKDYKITFEVESNG